MSIPWGIRHASHIILYHRNLAKMHRLLGDLPMAAHYWALADMDIHQLASEGVYEIFRRHNLKVLSRGAPIP